MAFQNRQVGGRMMPKHQTLLLGIGLISLTYSTEVSANDDPFITGTLSLEGHNDWRYHANYIRNRNDTWGFGEADITAHFSDTIIFRAIGTYDPVNDFHPDHDRFMADNGFHAKDIYFQYDDGTIGGQFGRITANFGSAWWQAPGIKATSLAEDYAIWDKWGVTGWYRFRLGEMGEVKAGASAFFLDTTILSSSAFGGRHRKTRWYGGPSNTGKPNSFNVSLDGSNIPALPGLSWHAAFLYQSADFRLVNGNPTTNVRDEKGQVLGLTETLNLTDAIKSTTLAEAVRFEDKGGNPGTGRTYLTLGETLALGGWHLTGAATMRATDRPSNGTVVDDLITAGFGYDFSNGVSVDLGWQEATFANQTDDTVKVRVRYVLPFQF